MVYGRVLSIQSHVVSGCVGNKAAVFPLQLLGFEVDAINTVQFSNHSEYPVFKGTRLTDTDIIDLLEGLQANNLTSNYTHVLTGYVGVPKTLKAISQVIKVVSANNKNLIYVCDPVFGDNGALYPSITQAIVDIYRDFVIPLASVVTPNKFEAETLTQSAINTAEDGCAAADKLHALGPQVVIITSIPSGKETAIHNLCSVQSGGQTHKWLIPVKKVPGAYSGTGDLFAALILGYSQIFLNPHRSPSSPLAPPSPSPKPASEPSYAPLETIFPLFSQAYVHACEKTVSAVAEVIRLTYDQKRKELSLIDVREILLTPPPLACSTLTLS
eukprot:GCRY01004553.1.p1 GENE.GCRY01004553.1~~GCRY01004553.1.p1  ORF type:complete len:328 (+),score=74.37 GCRY01004553.1:174-1157(+)